MGESRRNSIKLLRWSYYVLGGFYCSNKPSNFARSLWILFSTSCLILANVGTASRFYFSSLPFLFTINAIWPVCGSISFLILNPFITYMYHNDIKSVMDFIKVASNDKDLKSSEFSVQNEDSSVFKKIDVERKAFNMILYFLSTPGFLTLLSSGIDVLIRGGDSYKPMYQHIYPIANVEYISSTHLYFLIYFFEVLFSVIMVICPSSEAYFTVATIYKMYNIAVDYCKQLNDFSKLAIQLQNQDLKETHDLQRKNLIVLIKEYNKYVRVLKMILSYQNVFQSILIAGEFFMIMSFASAVILEKDIPTIVLIKNFLGTLAATTYFYATCEAGRTLEDIQLMIEREVYNLPWFDLPIPIRKSYFIFLGYVQYPMNVVGLKIFIVNRNFFPRMMKVIYSYMNILKNVHNK